MNKRTDDTLRQSLLELHYGLLETHDADSLRLEIDSDPRVAAAWVETLHLAENIADAATLQDNSPLPFSNTDTKNRPLAGPSDSQGDPGTQKRRSVWFTPTIFATTAACLAFVLLGLQYADRIPRKPQPVVQVQTKVKPSTRSDKTYEVVTRRVDDHTFSAGNFTVTPASLSFAVIAKGTTLFRGMASTTNQGKTKIILPDDLVIPHDAQLHITAKPISENDVASASTVTVPLEPTRCLTYLTTDRGVYRPGETVYFRSLTLDRMNLVARMECPIRYEVFDPSGSAVPGLVIEGVTERGVGNGSITIPESAPGGSYNLVAKSLDGFFPDEERKIEVRTYRVPRFKTKLEFEKRSFGPGDDVVATFLAERAEGGLLKNTKTRVIAKVDREVVHQESAHTDEDGNLTIRFTLPSTIEKSDGTLTVIVDDGGTLESTSKTIPIHVGRAEIEFFPEGGYLVNGILNRVYFTARDSLGHPIHIEGEVQDRTGHQVAKIETQLDGMGRFELTPQSSKRYSLKVTSPLDVINTPDLPRAVDDLPVIDTHSGVSDAAEPIRLTLRTRHARCVILQAVIRGELVGQRKLQLNAGDNTLLFPIHSDTSGVVRITVLDSETHPPEPLIERLVFRKQHKQLHIAVVDPENKSIYAPGESVRLNFQVRNENGEPTPAVLGLSIVDDASLRLEAAERPNLRTHFLLTSEVRKPEDLENANALLSNTPDADLAIDLLLGTQGWRRFMSGNQDQPNVEFREQLARLLDLDGSPPQSSDALHTAHGRIQSQWARYQIIANRAWQTFVFQARIVMTCIILAWSFVILVRVRSQSRGKFATFLLLALTTGLMYGCGQSENTVINPGAFDADASGNAMSINDHWITPNGPLVEQIEHEVEQLRRRFERNRVHPADRMLYDKYRILASERGDVESADGTTLITKEHLQALLKSRGIDTQSLADQLIDELRFPIRQYAHTRADSHDSARRDFAETLLWQPLVVTDSKGRASASFDLSDSITTFRVSMDAHSASGRLGASQAEIRTRLPLQIEPTLPLEVTAGDRVDLPVALFSDADEALDTTIRIETDRLLIAGNDVSRQLILQPNQRHREAFSIRVPKEISAGQSSVKVFAHASAVPAPDVHAFDGPEGKSENHPDIDSMSDAVVRYLNVAPSGFPQRNTISRQCTGRERVNIDLPKSFIPGSLSVSVRAYPSPIADIVSGIDSILREPHGCFEQASATNYPNTMALLYLQGTGSANPQVAEKAKGMLDRGYKKLVGYECKNLGYEWFGNDPGHEALSAFGLMQFTDMSKVMSVDQAMIDRTLNWLMARRDGNGGFKRNPRHLHSWSVEQNTVNAYVLWALSEADVAVGQPHRSLKDLAKELNQAVNVADASIDPYLIALSAAALMNVGRTDAGERLLKRLAKMQNENGSWSGVRSVVSSGGLSLKMETTALCVLALGKSANYSSQVVEGVTWLRAHRSHGGGFGSTQATVLALKALVSVGHQTKSQNSGTLKVVQGKTTLGQTRFSDDPKSASAVEIHGIAAVLSKKPTPADTIDLDLLVDSASKLNCTVDVQYHTTQPESVNDCVVSIDVDWAEDIADVQVGESIRITALLENESDQGQPMTVAVVGLPGGVEPRIQQFDELKKKGIVDYYELRGRDVVLYWRTIQPHEKKSINLEVTATVPGKYTGAASRAYLYYTAEKKHWSDPIAIEIAP